jgi:hypothetical protein
VPSEAAQTCRSERLGHASVAFTLTFYSHVLPGMDRDAANEIAGLIIGSAEPQPDSDVRAFVRTDPDTPLIDGEEDG